MNVGGGRTLIEKGFPGHLHVVAAIGYRHEPFVADEPVHAVPGDFAAIGFGREQLIEPFRARSAGEANRNAASMRRNPCQHAVGGGLRQCRRIGNGDDLALVAGGHRQLSFRQLRPSRSINSLASSGPSLPGSYTFSPLPPAFFQASRNGCTACQPASTLSARWNRMLSPIMQS